MVWRNFGLIVVFVGLGPLIGWMSFNSLGQLIILALHPDVLAATYIVGGIAALITAIAILVISRWLSQFWQRLLAVCLIGGVVSWVAGLIVLSVFGMSEAWNFAISFLVSGAVTSVLCLVLVEKVVPVWFRRKG